MTSQGRHGVSNLRGLDCSTITQANIKENFKAPLLGLYEGNSPVTEGFPTQRASNTENISI